MKKGESRGLIIRDLAEFCSLKFGRKYCVILESGIAPYDTGVAREALYLLST